MQHHEPSGYRCPFCNIVAGGEDPRTLIFTDEVCIATVALHQKEGNHGSLLVFPRQHVENIYEMPESIGEHMFKVTKALALALKQSLKCHGVTVRQNNEPASGQDVWHYHVHVIPRYVNDDFNNKAASVMPAPKRAELAGQIRAALGAA